MLMAPPSRRLPNYQPPKPGTQPTLNTDATTTTAQDAPQGDDPGQAVAESLGEPETQEGDATSLRGLAGWIPFVGGWI